jgi:putative phosphoesterase
MKIGVISDTHGLLRPAALKALEGCGHIIHAGDLGDLKILMELKKLAPVTLVRGNIDQGSWAASVSETQTFEIGKFNIYIIHNLGALDFDPAAAGFRMVISGHSHKPTHEVKKDVHYLNPGSAGPRRFKLPITLATLTIQEDKAEVQFVDLEKMEENLLEKLIHFDLDAFLDGE